jgi:voltage-gated potassium channel Kch
VALALIVVVLGTIGFHQYQEDHDPDHSFDLFDSLYRSIQLFGFGATLEPEIPTTLQIARILGPIVAGYAVIRGLIALSREQIEQLWIRVFRRNHVVVAGLGTAGFGLATALDAQGFNVVAIERDQHNPAIQGCRERGIGVLKGDSTDPSILQRARVDRASRLVVTCGEDAKNIDVAISASKVTDRRDRGVLTALAHLDDYDLLAMLKAQSLTSRSSSAFRLALFNVCATGAEILLEKHPPFAKTAGGRTWHVVLVGSEGVARDLVLNILHRWQSTDWQPEAELRLTLVGAGAGDHLARLRAGHPKIDEVPACEIEVWDVDSFAELQRREFHVRPSIFYVSLPAESQALSAALRLSGRTDIGDAPIVVALQDESAGMATALKSGGPMSSNVVPFGLFTQVFSPAAFTHTTNEALAIASHETHVRSQLDAGVTEKDDPSLVTWGELPEPLRDSNRLFADSIPIKLAAIGCVAQPARLADFRRPPEVFSDDEVNRLAPLEHDRWSEDMQRHLGYRRGAESKDPHGRLHPLIGVPFSELPRENQDKDRAKVRSIPEILARAGFKIVRNAGRDPAGDQALEVSFAGSDGLLNTPDGEE